MEDTETNRISDVLFSFFTRVTLQAGMRGIAVVRCVCLFLSQLTSWSSVETDGRIDLVFSMDDFIRPILHTRTVQKPKAYRENSGNPKIKILLSNHMSVIVFKCWVTRRYMRSFLYLFFVFFRYFFCSVH